MCLFEMEGVGCVTTLNPQQCLWFYDNGAQYILSS